MQQRQKDCYLAERSDSISLQYPTIPVHGTPASWWSKSQLIGMSSNPEDSSCDDTSSSVGDSTYDFVDDKSIVVSEDEYGEHLEKSTSSNDEHEVESQMERQTLERAEDFSNGSQDPWTPCLSRNFDRECPSNLRSQTMVKETDVNEEMDGSELAGQRQNENSIIVLIEHKNTSIMAPNEVEGSNLLKEFKGQEVSQIQHHVPTGIPSTPVLAKIKQTMASRRLVLDKPYKVLYVGDNSGKEVILKKLGSALCTSPRSETTRRSLYTIVPISFGNASSSDVELIDSTGIELKVEECTSASSIKADWGNDTISLNLSDQTLVDYSVESVWSGSGHTVTNKWILPDVAIFYLAAGDNREAKLRRHLARKFMSRHQVPCVVISQKSFWDKPAEVLTLDHKTPHVCLEVSHDRVIKRLPVDLATFLALDAIQMNRNLAYFAKGDQPPKLQVTSLPGSCDDTPTDLESTNKRRGPILSVSNFTKAHSFKKLPFFGKLLTPGLILLFSFLIYHFTTSVSLDGAVYRKHNTNATSGPCSTILESTAPDFSDAKSDSTLLSDLILPSKEQKQFLEKRTTPRMNTDVASLLLDRYSFAPNGSDKFKVSVIGDCHIVLKTPQWFTRSRKNHKLSFNITRSGLPIGHRVSTLFDGVYALEIPREDAYGTFNVSLWTTSKPIVRESLEVTFASSWIRRFSWKMATQGWNDVAQTISSSLLEDLNLVQMGFMTVYNLTSSNMQPWMDRARGNASAGQKEEEKTCKMPLNQTAKSKNIFLRKKMGLSCKASSKLMHESLAGSRKAFLCGERFRKDIFIFASDKSVMFGRQLRELLQAASINAKSIATEISMSQKKHLRETQKRALKIWWKIGGPPKQKSRINDMGGKLRGGNA